MRLQNRLIAPLGAALLLGTAAAGCNSDGNGGTVRDQNQTQDVRPDGTAVQQRTRTRETGSGSVVQETETRERKVVSPGSGGHTDPTKANPSK